ncbi:uncharacterized protein DUF397 [Nocardiopsis sp. Huas11]|uniref:DUF397 domain-containing protein n=1 Tax=Nocardiopsis sp. Huas11 TaxID=2183912 RepID=UPI000EAD9429|nr:DUF397 domain-containing protein [Nocardiopsis sp. Huas11]RKS08982.1 uncharacterized protein DUF397 [Nocardiopsis sp. Huas11]
MSGWHKSSWSDTGGHCVEVREHQDAVDVRDTQNRNAGHLSFTAVEWAALVATAAR